MRILTAALSAATMLVAATPANAGTFFLKPGMSATANYPYAANTVGFEYQAMGFANPPARLEVNYVFSFLTNFCGYEDDSPDCSEYYEVSSIANEVFQASSVAKDDYIMGSTWSDGYDGSLTFFNASQDVLKITAEGFADGTMSVPEPASWAMMLGGFGLVGGAMRSRRKVAVSFG